MRPRKSSRVKVSLSHSSTTRWSCRQCSAGGQARKKKGQRERDREGKREDVERERERRERERERAERERERESERERARKSGRGGAREGRTELERSGNGLGREEGKGVSGRNQWMRRMGDSRSEGAGSGIMQALRTRTGKKIINVYTHTSEITNKQPNV